MQATLSLPPLKNLKHQPHPSIVDAITSKKYPIFSNKVFSHNPELLLNKEFLYCHDLLQTKMSHDFGRSTNDLFYEIFSKFAGYTVMISNREIKAKDKLQKIAINAFKSLYDVPGHIDLQSFITSRQDMDFDTLTEEDQEDVQDIYLSLTNQRKEYLNQEIQKRVILNSLVHGSSIHIWKSIHYLIKEDIDTINPQLMDLYDAFIAITSFQPWISDIHAIINQIREGNNTFSFDGFIKMGYSKVDFKEQGSTKALISCHGMNLPILLHEINKGLFDYVISKGIPTDLTHNELKCYYAIADDHSQEIFHYLLSPSLWNLLLEASQVDNKDLPSLISNLSQLSYQELSEIFISLQDDITLGKRKLLKHGII